MNIIWNKINQLKPKYWIHMEDDWMFIKKDNYVTRAISYLEGDVCKSRNVQQVLFNRNYSEIINNFDVVGGEKLTGDDYQTKISGTQLRHAGTSVGFLEFNPPLQLNPPCRSEN